VGRNVKNSGLFDVKREGENITGPDLPHKLLIDLLNEWQHVFQWVLDTFSLKEPVLAKAKRSFHLANRQVEMRCERQGIACPQRRIDFLLIDRCEKS
jgi:hypothetical protein